MSSLKLKPDQLQSTPKVSIADLPAEIIHLICETIYDGSQRGTDELRSASSVSPRFREAALPLMFRTVRLAYVAVEGYCPPGLLNLLRKTPQLLKAIRHLAVMVSTGWDQMLELDQSEGHVDQVPEELRRCLSAMDGLQDVRFQNLNVTNMPFLQAFPQNRCIHVTLLDVDDKVHRRLGQLLQERPDWQWSMATDTLQSALKMGSRSEASVASLVQARALRFHESAFSFLNPDSGPFDPHYNDPYMTDLKGISMEHLEELHIGDCLNVMLRTIAWKTIRRLSLNGEQTLQDFLPLVTDLPNLEAIRIISIGSMTYHSSCPYPDILDEDNPLQGPGLPRLVSVDISAICSHVPIDRLITPGLRHLKLHIPGVLGPVDYYRPQPLQSGQRSPSDLIWAAKRAPLLERLELDVGPLKNLWHPTAIPGVDVNVGIYSFLQAITQFRNLKSLRLFPPYYEPPSADEDPQKPASQPISGEQAVRIYDYLRAQLPGLEILSICADQTLAERSLVFSAMDWEVRRSGATTVLLIRQCGAKKEERQVWKGQHKLTMQSRQRRWVKPYVHDDTGWILQRDELSEDEGDEGAWSDGEDLDDDEDDNYDRDDYIDEDEYEFQFPYRD